MPEKNLEKEARPGGPYIIGLTLYPSLAYLER